jgi:hypothetical protein
VGKTATCTLTINSQNAGLYTANATAHLTIGGVPLTVTTNGQAGNSGPAHKTYVDGYIKITPSSVNPVNQGPYLHGRVRCSGGRGRPGHQRGDRPRRHAGSGHPERHVQ